MSIRQTIPSRSLRARDIFFLVVAAAAPLAAIAGNGALGVLLGNGAGMPSAYLIAGFVLILFAVGFIRMGSRLRHSGAFYAYVRHGLGPRAGGAAAFVAIVVYGAMVIGSTSGFGFFASVFFGETLGIDLSWKTWSAICLALTAVVGYREVTLGARLLAVLLGLEVLVLIILAAAVLGPGSDAPVTFGSFAPPAIFSGSFGVGLMFAFVSFLGFESAAIYSAEARDGHRGVNRALVCAVVFIALFYAVAMWTVVLAFGEDKVVAAASENPGTLVFRAFARYTHPLFLTAAQLLMVTSALAATLALHNAAARYLFALSREGMLAASLGSLHARARSPHIASLTVTIASSIAIALFALGRADPLMTVLSSTFGLAALGIIILQSLTSLLVAAWTWRNRRNEPGSSLQLLIALIATLGLGTAAALLISNYTTLTGSLGALDHAPWLLPAAGLAGAVVAYRAERGGRLSS